MDVITLKGITKAFPGVLAVDHADFTLRAGEIHALVGKNGAGKSTLISMISGAQQPDSGEVFFESQPVPFHRLSELPVVTVFQESTLFPELSIADNIFAGNEPATQFRAVDERLKKKESARLLGLFGIDAAPTQKIGDLSPAEQKVVEILRAIRRQCQVLILDEPTASLTISESNRLFELLRNVRDTNVGIIYISHRLEEIFQASDRVTIIRDGRVQGTRDVTELSMDELVSMMVGKQTELAQVRATNHIQAHTTGEPLLRVVNLTDHYRRFQDVSFDLYRGEILGIAGLVGAGKTELATCLFGLRPPEGGEIILEGRRYFPSGSSEAVDRGIVYVTEDRKHQGLFLGMTLAENLSSPILKRVSNGLGFLSDRAMDGSVLAAVDQFDIMTTGGSQTVATLSGGNQQKVLLAMWLQLSPRVLIVDEPTVGIDVSTKVEIYRLLRKIAESDSAVILISSETKEILNNADRVLTMYCGRVTGEVWPGKTTEDELIGLISGSMEATQ